MGIFSVLRKIWYIFYIPIFYGNVYFYYYSLYKKKDIANGFIFEVLKPHNTIGLQKNSKRNQTFQKTVNHYTIMDNCNIIGNYYDLIAKRLFFLIYININQS